MLETLNNNNKQILHLNAGITGQIMINSIGEHQNIEYSLLNLNPETNLFEVCMRLKIIQSLL